MQHYLFLDIDGVLNDHSLNAAGYCTIDFDKMKLLNSIVKLNTDIILSTAWRYMIHSGECTIKGFENWLRCFGFVGYIHGYTERDEIIKDRSEQISKYVKDFNIKSYAIIDDLDLNISENHQDRFVQTDGKIGITDKEVKEIKTIFEKDKHANKKN